MTTETEMAMMRRDIQELRAQNDRHRAEIEDLKTQDHKRMRAAVVVLGGLVLSLVGYIWTVVVGGRAT